MKKIWALGFLLALNVAALGLQPGDPAPELKIKKWLLNGPVLLTSGRNAPNANKKLFVLLFWGAWSPASVNAVPTLCYLQNTYRRAGLRIIAVSRETESVVKKFIQQCPEINYAVALDNKSGTTLEYMGQSRIFPRLYIINAEKQILWVGEITDLAGVLKNIYAGKYDVSAQKDIARFQEQMEMALRRNNVIGVIKYSDEILKLDPKNGPAMRMRLFIYESSRQIDRAWKFLNNMIAKYPRNPRLYFVKLDLAARYPQYRNSAATLAKEFIKKFPQNAESLNQLAFLLLSRFPYEPNVLHPAMLAAKSAIELSRKSPDKQLRGACINTMALLYYRAGMPEKALALQKKITADLTGQMKKNSEKMINLYNAAIQARKQLKK